MSPPNRIGEKIRAKLEENGLVDLLEALGSLERHNAKTLEDAAVALASHLAWEALRTHGRRRRALRIAAAFLDPEAPSVPLPRLRQVEATLKDEFLVAELVGLGFEAADAAGELPNTAAAQLLRLSGRLMTAGSVLLTALEETPPPAA